MESEIMSAPKIVLFQNIQRGEVCFINGTFAKKSTDTTAWIRGLGERYVDPLEHVTTYRNY